MGNIGTNKVAKLGTTSPLIAGSPAPCVQGVALRTEEDTGGREDTGGQRRTQEDTGGHGRTLEDTGGTQEDTGGHGRTREDTKG